MAQLHEVVEFGHSRVCLGPSIIIANFFLPRLQLSPPLVLQTLYQ
jgi:hypothetical protein